MKPITVVKGFGPCRHKTDDTALAAGKKWNGTAWNNCDPLQSETSLSAMLASLQK